MTHTINELNSLRASINKAAVERGLIVFEGDPYYENMPSVIWDGDWLTFLDLAQEVHVQLLYFSEQKYDPDTAIVQETGDPDIICDGAEDECEASSVDNSDLDEKRWLLERIRESIVPWETQRGEIVSVSCVWMKDYVAHHWLCSANWLTACRKAIGAVIDEAEKKEMESADETRMNRTIQTKAAGLKLHEYATQMAQHPRFSDATSEAKREFMASQLFPDINADNDELSLLGYRPAMSIAQRATLLYWWDIEPLHRATQVERAQSLRNQGESIRNIATILKMSEAKVQAAINTTL
jgi:hypothetical protein